MNTIIYDEGEWLCMGEHAGAYYIVLIQFNSVYSNKNRRNVVSDFLRSGQ